MIPTSIWQIFFAPILAAVTGVMVVELLTAIAKFFRDNR